MTTSRGRWHVSAEAREALARVHALMAEKKFPEAAAALEPALRTTKGWAPLWDARACVYDLSHTLVHGSRRASRQDHLAYGRAVVHSYWQALELEPADPGRHLLLLHALSQWAECAHDAEAARSLASYCRIIGRDRLPASLQASLYSLEARALNMLGQSAKAWEAANRAVELEPQVRAHYLTRSYARRALGDARGAAADEAEAARLGDPLAP